MSLQAVLGAIADVRRPIELNEHDAFSFDGKERLLTALDNMRKHLLKNDVPAFDRYIDTLLADKPDTADYVLDDIFSQLGINMREQLSGLLT